MLAKESWEGIAGTQRKTCLRSSRKIGRPAVKRAVEDREPPLAVSYARVPLSASPSWSRFRIQVRLYQPDFRGTKINGQYYQKAFLMRGDAASDPQHCWRCIHVSARQRTVRDTVELLRHATPDFISPDMWPAANSPDVNPVGRDIWDVMQERVYVPSTNLGCCSGWFRHGLNANKALWMRRSNSGVTDSVIIVFACDGKSLRAFAVRDNLSDGCTVTAVICFIQ